MMKKFCVMLCAAAVLALAGEGKAATYDPSGEGISGGYKEWGPNGSPFIFTKKYTMPERIDVLGDAEIILSGDCEITFRRGINVPRGVNLTIKGTGKLIADMLNDPVRVRGLAGIGSNSQEGPSGNITIEGGTIIARGATAAAGIGGGMSAYCGTVTINGGTVTAYGGSGSAGIGDGSGSGYGGPGTITINGGTVTAYGGGYDEGGAGIGSGRLASCGTITINGGTVTAYGGGSGDGGGAGIGSGAARPRDWRKIACGSITINGGTVMAKGAGGGAGIGCGENNSGGGSIRINGGSVTAIGGSTSGIGGPADASEIRTELSSREDGSALIYTNAIKSDTKGFTSGVIFIDGKGTVYGRAAIDHDAVLSGDMTLTVKEGATLTIPRARTLTVSDDAKIENGGSIVNDGRVYLPIGTDIKALRMTGRGRVQMGGREYTNSGEELCPIPEPKPVPKKPTEAEERAIERADERYDIVKTSEDVEPGEIRIETTGIEGALRVMSVDAKVDPDDFVVIASGQLESIPKVDGRDIVFVKRFIHPTDPTKWADVDLSEVAASTAKYAELDATVLVVNGKAPDLVKALDEYVPSGLIDGQGLIILKKEEWDENIVVIYDGIADDRAIDPIYAKEVDEPKPSDRSSSGGGCAAGAAALVALIGLAVMKRRKK